MNCFTDGNIFFFKFIKINITDRVRAVLLLRKISVINRAIVSVER